MLDAVGNTVKALTKAWAAAAAALASLLLCAAYLDELRRRVVTGDVAGLAMAPASPGRPVRPAGGPRRGVPRGRAGPLAREPGDPRGHPGGAQGHRRGPPAAQGPAARVRPGPRGLRRDRLAGGPPSRDRPRRWRSRRCPSCVGVALRFARTEDNPLVVADSVAALVWPGRSPASGLPPPRKRRGGLGQREEVHRDRRARGSTARGRVRARAWTTRRTGPPS